jgi:uncharacterized membrane protein YidH (DUF202 family)
MQLVNVAFAAGKDAQFLLQKAVTVIVNPIITLFFMAAIVLFVYGIFQFIRNTENEDKRNEGKRHMLVSVIGLLIIIASFAIVNLISDQFGIRQSINNNVNSTGGNWILNN